jgi:hypothetical protein
MNCPLHWTPVRFRVQFTIASFPFLSGGLGVWAAVQNGDGRATRRDDLGTVYIRGDGH